MTTMCYEDMLRLSKPVDGEGLFKLSQLQQISKYIRIISWQLSNIIRSHLTISIDIE